MSKTRCSRRVLTYLLGCTICFFLGISTTHAQSDTEAPIYEVNPGDTLTEIAFDFGSIIWWMDIYEANRDKIEDPNLIYPGQRLAIPDMVAQSSVPSNMNQVQKIVAMSKSGKYKTEEGNQRRLKKFREAFKEVIESKEKTEKKPKNLEQQGYQGLGLGGLILDETRSKMGNNFYSIFYKHWEDPNDAQNFTITVSEQPMPSRGTLVQVEIDNQLVFRNRLEPRYYKTEQAAKRAVKICQRRLQRIAATQNEFAGY